MYINPQKKDSFNEGLHSMSRNTKDRGCNESFVYGLFFSSLSFMSAFDSLQSHSLLIPILSLFG